MPRIAERPNPEFYTSSAALPSPNPQLLPEVSANPVALVLQPQAFLSFQTLPVLLHKLLFASELSGGSVFKMQIPRVHP